MSLEQRSSRSGIAAHDTNLLTAESVASGATAGRASPWSNDDDPTGAGIAVQAGSGRETASARTGDCFEAPEPRPRNRRATRQPATRCRRHRCEPSTRVDVICGGMYRACSTWQYEVAAHLIEHYLGGQRLGYLTGEQYAARSSRRCRRAPTTRRGKTSRWSVVKSHEGDRSFARALAEERAVAVYAYRDVREVVFSLMHKRGMTFEQLLRQGMIHQILANDRFWMAQPDVLVQRVRRLARRPGPGRHRAGASSRDQTRRRARRPESPPNTPTNRTRLAPKRLRRRLQEAGVDLESAANAQICDPTTLLHWNHIRQGDSQILAHARQPAATADTRASLRPVAEVARLSPPIPMSPGKPRYPLRERFAFEVDLMVGTRNIPGSVHVAAVSANGPAHQANSRAARRCPGRRHRVG